MADPDPKLTETPEQSADSAAPRGIAPAKKPSKKAKPKNDAIKTSVAAANKKVEDEVKRRTRTVRNFPAAPFEEAVVFARQVFDFSSGGQVRRLSIFSHINKSPDSGASRQLITNASRYGLLKGSYASEFLELTPDGLRAVDPDVTARDQGRARIKLAIDDIEPFAKLHERFVNKTLPVKAALVDAAKEFGVITDAAEEAGCPGAMTFWRDFRHAKSSGGPVAKARPWPRRRSLRDGSAPGRWLWDVTVPEAAEFRSRGQARHSFSLALSPNLAGPKRSPAPTCPPAPSV